MTVRGTTSPLRTYRYLRIANAATVVVIFAAIAVTIPEFGVLPSISHYYYTPAGTLLVGSLVAASTCFLALSGRGPERVLLDVAAILVPLVAIVPTAIRPGSVPGVAVSCPGTCVPAAYVAGVDIGVTTYLIVGTAILVLAGVLTATGQVDRGAGTLSAAIAVVVLAVVALTWAPARAAFLQWAHYVAAIGFFGMIAAVALVTAFRPTEGRRPRRSLRIAYAAIAIALAVDLLLLVAIGGRGLEEVSGVFIGEVIALVLFFSFWILQTIQNWDEPDPTLLPRGGV